MKKLFLLVLLFVSFSASAQRFPSVDSLKNYILRYVKNSAQESFTNLRMQNVVYGLTEFFQTNGIDTIWKSGDTLKYRKNGVNRTVGVFSGGGGSMIYPGAGIPVSTGSAWGTSITDNSTNWNTAYTNRITSLTTTGTSGAATLSGNVLNIPQYSGGGGGSQNLQQTTAIDSTTTHGILVGSDGVVKSGLTDVSPYVAFSSGAADYGSAQSIWAVNYNTDSRIRQKGYIRQIKIYMASVPARLTSFYITIWRKSATLDFNIIDSINILPQLTSGVNTITLQRDLYAQDGDFVGWGYSSTASGSNFLDLTAVAGSVPTYYVTDATHPADGIDWVGRNVLAGNLLPVYAYMNKPDAVFIGHSQVAGFNDSWSAYLYNNNTPGTRGTSMPEYVSDSLNWRFQNMGLGGETTTQMVARFTADVVEHYPQYAVILSGINDIATGVSTVTIINNFRTVLAACTTNSIKPVLIKILPWTSGTLAQVRQADTVNTQLAALYASYGALWVDATSVMGEFRGGGDVGNMWNFQSGMSGDGTHPSIQGYAVLSRKVVEAVMTSVPIAFPASPNDNNSIVKFSSRTKGLGLPVWNENQRLKIDSNTNTGLGVIGYQENGTEGIYVHTNNGMKKVVTQDYPASGTYATRIAMTGQAAGHQYYQTDGIPGSYVWSGSFWTWAAPEKMIACDFYKVDGGVFGETEIKLTTVSTGSVTVGASPVSGLDVPIVLNTGGATGGLVVLKGAAYNSYPSPASTRYIYSTVIRAYTLSDGTNRYTCRFGITNPYTTNAEPTSGLYFKYSDNVNGGNWYLVASSGGFTVADSGVPVVANTTYKLAIVTGTFGAKYYINDVLVGTLTTNIPTAFGGITYSIFQEMGAGGGAIYIDRGSVYKY